MRWLKRILLLLGCAYVGSVALLTAFQRELIYTPDSGAYVPPKRFAMLAGVAEVSLCTADGVGLVAWHAPAPQGRPTVVIFPGQSGSLGTHRFRLTRLREAGLGVLLVAYRGYAGNPGAPSEQGLLRDARAALDWLASRGTAASAVVAYGISLGSGVATAMAAERALGALILEAPYTSIPDVAAARFPGLPVRWLIEDRFDSAARIGAVTEPLLVMHGAADDVIAQRFGRELYARAPAAKEGYWPALAGHHDLFDRGGFDAALAFIERTLGPDQRRRGATDAPDGRSVSLPVCTAQRLA